MVKMGLKDRSKFRKKYLQPFLEEDLLAMTIPQKPTTPNQQYYLTEKGKRLLREIQNTSS
ncbi:MAG: hypothetical protein FDX18_00370 [Chlorobium sp.]|nr:MAG: hypothetical protein FDX18_00370 [Chlorobium sp.]